MGVQSNAQREMQLLAQWLTTLPAGWKSKTHVRVGTDPLRSTRDLITPTLARAFLPWSDWADARVFTGTQVWIVEAKLVASAGAYGQLLDYLDQYPQSEDAQNFRSIPVVGVVLAAAVRDRASRLFAQYGLQTILFAPEWTKESILQKILGSTVNL
jgi:hypothetical protein